MWLIDTKTLKLVFKTDPSQVKYAILSHTWEEDEVSFQEFQVRAKLSIWTDFHVMDLECFVTGLETDKTKKNTRTPVGIYLAKLPGGYARISPRSLAEVESRETFNVLMEVPQTIYAFKTMSQAAFYSLESEYRRQVAVKLNTGGTTILQAEPHPAWHPQNNLFRIQPPFTCFWLLECCYENHTTFECLVICNVSFDTQTGSYGAKAQILVEAEGVWDLDHCKFIKPPRHRFHEKTATRLFREWQARKDRDSCQSAVHAGPNADVVVSISESACTTDGHYRFDMSVKYVEPARESGD
ncbi:uncharacterized protein PG998_000597 [Apiospora kogelbergensis]|uniref:uncharacterized protein n=1 Tax=Apiospora kogelbergensis TaxID=1337665 RepID=UPI003131A2BD